METTGDGTLAAPTPVGSLNYASPDAEPTPPRRRPVMDGVLIVLWLAAVLGLFAPFGSGRSPIAAIVEMIGALGKGDLGIDTFYGLFLLPMLMSVPSATWHVLVLLRPSRPIPEARMLRTLGLAMACLPLAVVGYVLLHDRAPLRHLVPLLAPVVVAGGGLAIAFTVPNRHVLGMRVALLAMATAYATPAVFMALRYANRHRGEIEWLLVPIGLLPWALQMAFILTRLWRPRA